MLAFYHMSFLFFAEMKSAERLATFRSDRSVLILYQLKAFA